MGRTILFVHPSDELYGSDRCLLEIVRGLPAGDRAIVALPTDLDYDGALSRELEAAGARVEHVDMLVLRRAMLSPRRLPRLVRRFVVGKLALARIIRRRHVALVHSNTVAVVCGASAAMIARRPHVWHVHEHIGGEPLPYRLLIRLVLAAFPGQIVANSRSVARALIDGSGRLLARTRVIENSVNPEIVPVCRRTPGSPERPVIGVVGRLSPRKGIAEALEAAALLVQRGNVFEMRFVGGPPPGQAERIDEYQALAVRLGLESYVAFAGEVESVTSEYAGFDLLLLPSQRPEPFGLVVIEGMAAGLPVVATLNGGGSDEILRHGRTGFYCGREPEAMAAMLEYALRDAELRRRIGAAAMETARLRYSRERYRSAFRHLYDRLVPPKS
jgi:hypothetical protein